jgi:4a-hydroxytetrahydrobiopterin dehydratase
MEPAFSKGSDVDSLKQAVNPLLSTNGGKWSLVNDGEALERTFKFKTFTKTWVSTSPCHLVSFL